MKAGRKANTRSSVAGRRPRRKGGVVCKKNSLRAYKLTPLKVKYGVFCDIIKPKILRICANAPNIFPYPRDYKGKSIDQSLGEKKMEKKELPKYLDDDFL